LLNDIKKILVNIGHCLTNKYYYFFLSYCDDALSQLLAPYCKYSVLYWNVIIFLTIIIIKKWQPYWLF